MRSHGWSRIEATRGGGRSFNCSTRRSSGCIDEATSSDSGGGRSEPAVRLHWGPLPRGSSSGAVAALSVLLLGDPRLRIRASEVTDFASPSFRAAADTLAATLADFRRRHGFGRAIAAPQIGIGQRFIAIDLGKG
ncbi:MAG: peptide deformylase, partial [Thermoanaerobaculia bacterium]